ncbi:MAG: site-specific DNA-methyltransferase [Candidatus Pacebacteria bacterium]|nr:site-specific DNA-methyltransferase [Candidatus Paceibacterota bacterium]
MPQIIAAAAAPNKTVTSDNIKSVYSKLRTAKAPVFKGIEGLAINQRQQMNGLELLARVEDKTVPLVFFDPQYRTVLDKQAYGNEGARQKHRASLPQMPEDIIAEFLSEIERVLTPQGHLMLWVDKFIVCSGLESLMAGTELNLVDMVTWNKKRIGMGYRTRRTAEYLVIFQKSPVRAKGVWCLHNIPDVWDEKITDRSHSHSKPVELQKQLIEAVTNPGDLVIDPAAGSFSVMAAAMAQGRRFLGCDLLG